MSPVHRCNGRWWSKSALDFALVPHNNGVSREVTSELECVHSQKESNLLSRRCLARLSVDKTDSCSVDLLLTADAAQQFLAIAVPRQADARSAGNRPLDTRPPFPALQVKLLDAHFFF